jgi:hypothetical protein
MDQIGEGHQGQQHERRQPEEQGNPVADSVQGPMRTLTGDGWGFGSDGWPTGWGGFAGNGHGCPSV